MNRRTFINAFTMRERPAWWMRRVYLMGAYACFIPIVNLFMPQIGPVARSLAEHKIVLPKFVTYTVWTINGLTVPTVFAFGIISQRVTRRIAQAGGLACPHCTYDLRTLPLEDGLLRCPECGKAIAPEKAQALWSTVVRFKTPYV